VRIVSVSLLVVAIIHLIPLAGVIGAERLASLHGLDFSEPNLAILMRHRAVLFGLLGGFLGYAAFRASLQRLALVAGLVSVASFLLLAWSIGGYNPLIRRVVAADVVALVCLVIGVAAHVFSARARSRGVLTA
jgi:hypothetical protein